MITINFKEDFFILTFPFNQEDLDSVRNLPNREWVKEKKVWRVPITSFSFLSQLKNALWEQEALVVKKQQENLVSQLLGYKFQFGKERGILRPYQTVGIEFLKKAKTALLADDMGLGKSVQALQALLDLGLKRNLIISPATLKWNWEAEFKKHFQISPLVIAGNKQERKSLWENSTSSFVIANYELLQIDWEAIPKNWDSIILDEVVYIKTHKAARAKYAKKLKAPYKFALSGLPWENNLMEFHSIMEWVKPGLLPSAYKFKYRYCDINDRGQVVGYKKDKIAELYELVSPYLLRRTKQEVLKELPNKVYIDYPLELSDKSLAQYKKLRGDFLSWLSAENSFNWRQNALTKLMKLRQFVEFPSTIGSDLPSEKLQWLNEAASVIDKLVIFTFFKTSVGKLVKHFNTPYFITGDVPTEKRVKIIEDFNSQSKAVLVSDDAGRFGLNITGADHIAHFGSVYNPATMVQREDRLHRIGQRNTVMVLSPFFKNTIDEGIREIFLSRKNQITDFMEGVNTISLEKLTKKDFEKLVGKGD